MGLHAHVVELQVGGALHVGVCKLVTALEYSGLAEDDVFLSRLVVGVDEFGAVEPHQVYHTMSVGEVCHDAFLPWSHGKLLETQYAAFDLDERHVARQLVNAIDFGAINVFIGIVFQQVTPSSDIELLAQYLFLSRANARQIHDVLV